MATACDKDECAKPIIQISKTFTVQDIQWNETFSDPTAKETILAMDEIAKRVNMYIFLHTRAKTI